MAACATRGKVNLCANGADLQNLDLSVPSRRVRLHRITPDVSPQATPPRAPPSLLHTPSQSRAVPPSPPAYRFTFKQPRVPASLYPFA